MKVKPAKAIQGFNGPRNLRWPRGKCERDRIRPAPEDARQQSIICVSHELTQPLWLDAAIKRHDQSWHDNRLWVLLPLYSIRPTSERFDPECSPTIVVRAHAGKPPGDLVSNDE